MKNLHWTGVAVVAVLALSAKSASAQINGGQGSQAPSASGIGDIIVTAQRRSETLQRVPASVEVLSGKQLQAAHINNLANIQEVSPSLIVTQSTNPSAATFTIRGIGTSVTDRGFEQSVGVYIDGVFRGRPGAALQDLLDIDRVEVLRGPQSTLFGRNNSAGAINITTALPNSKAFGMYAEATYGNYNAVQARLSVNVPIITDELALRVSAAENRRDGFLKAPNLPRGDIDAQDRQSFRAQLYWTPGSSTRVRMIGDYSQLDDRCCSLIPLFISDAAANPPFVPGVTGNYLGYTPPTPGTRGVSPSDPTNKGVLYHPFDRVSDQDGPSEEKSTDKGLSLQVDQDLGNLTLTAIGSTRDYDTHIAVDVDGTDSLVLNGESYPATRIKENSAEVRLQNASGGPIEFVVGGYYFDQNIRDRNYLTADIKPLGILIPEIDSSATNKTRSGAVFGQATYNLSRAIRVTGGLRYLDESKRADVSAAPGTLSFPASFHRNDSAVMGTATIAYQPVQAVNLYARYSRGYKSGGTNLLLTLPPELASPTVKPETTDAYEAGVKLRMLDGRLSTNLAIYTQTVNDQQVQAYDSNVGVFISLNAAKVRARGVEGEVAFHPIKVLTLNGSVSYLDAKYLSFPGAPPPAGSTIANQDLTGRTPLNSPRWTMVGGVVLDQPINDDVHLIGNVTLRHATGYYTDLALTSAFRNGNTNFLDASVEIALSNGFGIQFWGRNLTKQNAYVLGVGTPFGAGSLSAFIDDPRTYGVTLRFHH